jgi:hypothetical protein
MISSMNAFAKGVPTSISIVSFSVSNPLASRIRFSDKDTSEIPTAKAISATADALPCGAVRVICLIV